MNGAKYTQPATRLTPALVIYLIDASESMNELCGPTTKMELVNQALREAIKGMVLRSMRDYKLQPRYSVALFAYSTKVVDLLHGIRSLPELLRIGGLPELTAGGNETDTAAGFAMVEDLLLKHLHTFKSGPAPLVCHLTDALLTTQDPAPIVQRIQAMSVDDGPVLVENVLMAEKVLRKPVHDWQRWGGVLKTGDSTDQYAKHLFSLSSPLPESYRQSINRSAGYQLQKGASLFFPGTQRELVRLALAASSATQL